MSCELDIIDRFGRRVLLTHSNWERHLLGVPPQHPHPEVVPYHDEFVLVLQDPDWVIEAERDGQYHFYRAGIATGQHAGLYLHVVTRPDGDHEWLATWRLSRQVDVRGRIVWSRPGLTS